MIEVVLYVLGIVIIVFGLAVSIGLHEIGHLVPAKLFGVKVTQYMIGFGKTLWSKKRGDTEYGIKMIPLGGYISMIGMYPPAKDGTAARSSTTGLFNNLVQDGRKASAEQVGEDETHRTFYSLPMWKKITIMLGGPLMNLILAFVFFAIVLVGFGVPQSTTTLASVNQCLISAGSASTSCTPEDQTAPGAAAGLEPGDKILAINGSEITDWNQARDLIAASPAVPLAVTYLRDGAEYTSTIVPAANERYRTDEAGQIVDGADGQPEIETVGMIGVTPTSENVPQSLGAVPQFVGDNVTAVAGVIIRLPERMVDVWNAAFGAEVRDPNGPLSVVGVGRIAGEAVSMQEAPVESRVSFVLSLLGSLNVALFVFNLVPLLPLDGGHVLGALYEGLKRSWAKLWGKPDPGPIDTAKMLPVTMVVAVLLGAMSLLLIYADLVKPISLFG